MHNDGYLRTATIEDIDILVNHHVKMFKEIMEIDAMQIDDNSYTAMAISYRKKLNEQLPVGTCKAWIVFQDGNRHRPIASAAMSIIKMVPTPFDSSYETGYLHSIYTEKEWRRKGYAELLVKTAIQDASRNSINRIDLTASSEGKKLYDKVGFQVIKSMMRLYVRNNT